MQLSPLPLAGAFTLAPKRFGDDRGWFCEHWNAARMAAEGFDAHFVQDNLSYSAHAGTLRGLHYQAPPRAQGKLVSVITGHVTDVIVDIREGSPTRGRHAAVELSGENGVQLWVPPGFLHGFVARSGDVRMLYKVTAPYSAEHDGSIAWDDPALGIDWGVQDPVLSDKDRAAPTLAEREAAGAIFPKGWEEA
jgi:dTDP-4-dehydrorhamnose 3,5-epimerase